MRKHAVLVLAIALAACATAPLPTPVAAQTAVAAPECVAGDALINSVLWVQTAAEYRAATMGIYANAHMALDAALADPKWSAEPQQSGDYASLPPAIILDLDETSILNGKFEARVVKQGKTYDADMWKQWVSESGAASVPGAAEFLSYAKSRGVTPFYITNRDTAAKAGTRANVEKLGYPLLEDGSNFIIRGEREEWKSADKSPRRAWVASKYRVLLLLGDDLNDFANARDKSRAERDQIIADNSARWGRQWFMLPNPMYGSWESAASGGTGTPCEQMKKKVDALMP